MERVSQEVEKERRECKVGRCGWVHVGTPAENLAAFCEHSAEHNPSEAQWTVAYKRIQWYRNGEKGAYPE